MPQFGNVPVCDEYERSIAPSERLLEAIKAPVGRLIDSGFKTVLIGRLSMSIIQFSYFVLL